jgi:hypothetical protein
MTEEAIIKIVLDEAIYVHGRRGPGMLESVYKPAWHIGYKSEDYFWKRKSQCLYLLKKLNELWLSCRHPGRKVIVETNPLRVLAPRQIQDQVTSLEGLLYN